MPRKVVSLNWVTSEASGRTRAINPNTFLEILPSSSGSSLKHTCWAKRTKLPILHAVFLLETHSCLCGKKLGSHLNVKENSWWVPATIQVLCKNCRWGFPTFYIRRQEMKRPKYIQDHTSRKLRHWSLRPVQQEYEFSRCCLTTPEKK